MNDIDFPKIAARCGGQREAFEELCCQIAQLTLKAGTKFVRLRGAGGDGGVECFSEDLTGAKIGWQAKYVFDFEGLLTQLTDSLITALDIHPTLQHYVVCFPFDLTGPTGRKGKSELAKFDAWKSAKETAASQAGRTLKIEAYSASIIRSKLLSIDSRGGIREFFFNQTILSSDWFSQHVTSSIKTAGPRYTPELSIDTDIWQWFEAVVQSSTWSNAFSQRVHACVKKCNELRHAVERPVQKDAMTPAWPENIVAAASNTLDRLTALLESSIGWVKSFDSRGSKLLIEGLQDSIDDLRTIESSLIAEFEKQHGEGRADSPGFRQFMAEYQCSFPAANVDDTRETIAVLEELYSWLSSPAGRIAIGHTFIMTGAAGSGKTHGVCDVAIRRLENHRYTLICYGHEFRGDPECWTRFRELLGLPAALDRDGVLDCLNAVAEASGEPLIVVLDAINETKPLRYWKERIDAFSDAIQRRPNLRLCITCRSSFVSHCLPEKISLFVAEHQGFSGKERHACQAFFAHYGLQPPLTPILQPELANPLYLRLVCETARSRGLIGLPIGWRALSTAIKAFLDEKERQFSSEYETNAGAAIVSGSLLAIAKEIARSGTTELSWSKAIEVIKTEKPAAMAFPILDWLVRADLVIEDAARPDAGFDSESWVRPSFERLGDFLIAAAIIGRINPTDIGAAFQVGGHMRTLFESTEAVSENNGVISALSVLLPESLARGNELTDFLESGEVRSNVASIVLDSFPSRDPTSLTVSSMNLVKETLRFGSEPFKAMDAVVAISWQPSQLDAFWLDAILKERPLAKRDAFWCGFLHNRYEENGVVRRLIDAAFELPLRELDPQVAERWLIGLLWFTAASDRRVKDFATRGATAILCGHPSCTPQVLCRMMETDDDALRERVLLAVYGALLITRDISSLQEVCRWICNRLTSHERDFDNAMIRDHARCICEFAEHLKVLPAGCNFRPLSGRLRSEWPLVLPSDEKVERWKELPKLAHSCLDDDFFFYTLLCLDGWEDAVSKVDMARWILNESAERMGYEHSQCDRYDNYMLGKYGAGRGKPVWAERIGKKYQWISMFRLAARLFDHAERKRHSWESEPSAPSLILSSERQLDPTLPTMPAERRPKAGAWWIPLDVGQDKYATQADVDWVSQQRNVPELEHLLCPFVYNGQKWRLCDTDLSWNNRPQDAPFGAVYRTFWLQLRGYLVKRRSGKAAFQCLDGRNFFGRWMPENKSWLSGFAAEYPWATSFISDSDDYIRDPFNQKLPCKFIPVSEQIAAEWEYDASMAENIYFRVPDRGFLGTGDLWWNGRDSFCLQGGNAVFRDPSLTEAGPSALIADIDEFASRLDRMGCELIWTLMGEKIVIASHQETLTPRCTFSQVARLQKNGKLQSGPLMFFNDYNEAVGPKPRQ